MSSDRRYSCAWQPIRRRAMENAYVHIPNPEPRIGGIDVGVTHLGGRRPDRWCGRGLA